MVPRSQRHDAIDYELVQIEKSCHQHVLIYHLQSCLKRLVKRVRLFSLDPWVVLNSLYFINTKLGVNLRFCVQALAKHVEEDEQVEDIHPDFCE